MNKTRNRQLIQNLDVKCSCVSSRDGKSPAAKGITVIILMNQSWIKFVFMRVSKMISKKYEEFRYSTTKNSESITSKTDADLATNTIQ